MMKMMRIWVMLLAAVLMMFSPCAEGGVLSSLVKKVAKVTGRAADDLLKQAAKESPVVARVVSKYGDEAIVRLARNPKRLEMVEKLGDDAAEAFLRHADIADDVLKHCPDAAVAGALKNMSTESAQCLSICASKLTRKLDPDDYKNLARIVQEGGDEAAKKLSKMSPSSIERVLHTAQTAGLVAAVTMVMSTAAVSDGPWDFLCNLASVGAWIWNHPILTLLLLGLLVCVMIRFPNIVLGVLLWIPRVCIAAVRALLRRLFRKKDATE